MPRVRCLIAALAAATVAVALAAPPAGAERKRYCRDFATYDEVKAHCLQHHGTLLYCGGLDRDRDEMPCECNVGGPDASAKACMRWRDRAARQNEREAATRDE